MSSAQLLDEEGDISDQVRAFHFSTKELSFILMNLPARNLSKTYILEILLSASSKSERKIRRIFCIPYPTH